MTPSPVALTIAGSDSSAGAGLQADLQAFIAAGVHGLTVASAIVAERPGAVLEVMALAPGLVARQLEALLPYYPVTAAKTGLLPNAAIIAVVHAHFARYPVPLVVDPVAMASAGVALAAADAPAALLDLIRTRATLVTPNRSEAEHFLGAPVTSGGAVADAAVELRERFGCAVLLKGGHFEGPDAIDWLADDSGVLAISAPRLPDSDVHGTGCVYSAAITARLAQGMRLREAIQLARRHLHLALARHRQWTTPDGHLIKALAQFPEP